MYRQMYNHANYIPRTVYTNPFSRPNLLLLLYGEGEVDILSCIMKRDIIRIVMQTSISRRD
jgi:hypothetical protein